MGKRLLEASKEHLEGARDDRLINRNAILAAVVQLPMIALGGVTTVNDVMRDSDSPLVEPDNGQQSDRVAAGPTAMQSRAARGRRSASRASDQLQRGYANAEVRFKEAVDDYPLGIGSGFVGLGLLAGLFLPRSEAEDEWFGESADDMKDAVTDKGEEFLERGKDVAGRVADEAADEAERQGLTADNAASALGSVGTKVGSVVEAAKEEGKEAAQDEHLTPEDLKSEAHSEAGRTKDKAAERVGSS